MLPTLAVAETESGGQLDEFGVREEKHGQNGQVFEQQVRVWVPHDPAALPPPPPLHEPSSFAPLVGHRLRLGQFHPVIIINFQ